MKPNTQKFVSGPCDQIGLLTLVGVLGQVATFVGSNLRIVSPEVFKKHMRAEFLDSIVTEPINNTGYVTTAIFQCRFEGPLRNPKGFLKVARNRLHKVIGDAEQEIWDEIEV